MNMLTCSVMVLLVLTSVAKAQMAQTTDSEAQLASVLCRNPTGEATDGLLDKNEQFVTVTLWKRLLDCASVAQGQRSHAKSIKIYKLILRVANRLNKPELMATTYYHLGRTYSEMSDLENSIQAYETSRKVLEQAGSESNLIYVLGDLGVLYLTAEDYEKAHATIHLATHGVLDNRDALNSYLLLTKTDDETENEGLLQAREIIDMHLDTDLAVLSACETGNGRISSGEGVIGMSWAFLVAGTRSVVVSQWRVNSASTSQLMKNFYHALARQKDLKGPNKSLALKDASLHLLKDRRYRHPFYWAGFVLVSSN